jgi:hypothetical protein
MSNWTLNTANVSVLVNDLGNIELYYGKEFVIIMSPEELEIISEWVRFVREKKL